MTVDTIVVGIIAILLLGLAIYLWIDRKGWIETAKDAARTCGAAKEAYKELDSFAKALDEENAELTVKCNQYEALIGERLDEIPEVDCCEVDCEKCLVGDCELRAEKDETTVHTKFKKPCCSCDNGVYNTAECIGCDPENSYENYTPIKY